MGSGSKLEDLNAQIDTLIKKLTISDKFRGWATKYLHEIRQNEAKSNQDILVNKQKSLARIMEQLQSLLLKYTSPENVNEEIMNTQELQGVKNTLLKQKTSLESDLKEQGEKIEEWVSLSERTFNFARFAHIWFAKGNMETKRAVFAALGSHLITEDQKLNVELHPFFKVIFENLKAVEKELIKIRTSESVVNKRQIATILAKCPTLRCLFENIRTELSGLGGRNSPHTPLPPAEP